MSTSRALPRIGYAAMTARIMPLWIAQEQGFFVKYGIDSEPVFIRGGTTLVTGLASGDVQIGRTAGAAVLSAVAAGHDLKMLATFSSRNTSSVKPATVVSEVCVRMLFFKLIYSSMQAWR